MAYWLLKTEPSTYSFDDLVRDKQTRWDGITNPVALRNLRSAKAGDVAFIYHTGDEKRAVGTAQIVGSAYADPKNAKLAVIDLKAGHALSAPVTLATLKTDPLFADSPLVRQGRLSFVPLTDAQYQRISELANALTGGRWGHDLARNLRPEKLPKLDLPGVPHDCRLRSHSVSL